MVDKDARVRLICNFFPEPRSSERRTVVFVGEIRRRGDLELSRRV